MHVESGSDIPTFYSCWVVNAVFFVYVQESEEQKRSELAAKKAEAKRLLEEEEKSIKVILYYIYIDADPEWHV